MARSRDVNRPAPKTGPRSLGRVLQAARYADGFVNQEEMYDKLGAVTNINRRYAGAIDPRKSSRAKISSVSRWEREGPSSMAYAVLHHYARLHGVRTHALYAVARLYAHLRQAANGDGDPLKDELNLVKDHAETLMRLATAAKRLAKEYRKIKLGKRLGGAVGTDKRGIVAGRMAVILELLDASRDVPRKNFEEEYRRIFDLLPEQPDP